MRYIEGLETLLINLEDALETFKSKPSFEEGDELLACPICFEIKELCSCEEDIAWPIRHVITKLKMVLIRQREDMLVKLDAQKS